MAAAVESGLDAVLLNGENVPHNDEDDDICGLDLGIQDGFFRIRARAQKRLGVDKTPEWRMFFDVIAMLACWQTLGVVVFHYFGAHPHDDHWTYSYAFYYSTNIGYNLGSAPHHADTPFGKIFTIFYCLTGNAVIVGGLGLLNRIISARAMARKKRRYSMLWLLSGIYAIFLGFGVATAHYAANLKSPIDAILFAVTNSTSCGLLVGDQTKLDWLWTGISLILSVPAAAAWTSEVTHLAFTKYKRFEEAEVAARRESELLVAPVTVAALDRAERRARVAEASAAACRLALAKAEAQLREAHRLGFRAAAVPQSGATPGPPQPSAPPEE